MQSVSTHWVPGPCKPLLPCEAGLAILGGGRGEDRGVPWWPMVVVVAPGPDSVSWHIGSNHGVVPGWTGPHTGSQLDLSRISRTTEISKVTEVDQG